jgi:hypothetical protein
MACYNACASAWTICYTGGLSAILQSVQIPSVILSCNTAEKICIESCFITSIKSSFQKDLVFHPSALLLASGAFACAFLAMTIKHDSQPISDIIPAYHEMVAVTENKSKL